MKNKRTGCGGLLLFLLLTIVILGGAWLYTNWRSSQTVLPPGLTMNDISMGGMTREQALNVIALAYMSPITVHYGSEVEILLPEMVDLALDLDATAQNLDEALATRSDVESFVDYTLDRLLRRDPENLEVKAIVNYSRERVDAFMERLAQKYDHPPQKPVSLPDAGTFRPPRAGTELDLDASRPRLIAAILAAEPSERAVQLVVEAEPAPKASIELLRTAILTSLGDFNGTVGIFIKNMTMGQELCINCNVAFSAVSTLKLGIVLELYRQLDAPPNVATTRYISATLTASDNAAANLLLAQIGDGDAYSGALRVTDLLWSLGLENTFLAAPYDLKEGATPIATAANTRADVATNPDPYIQTTPIEMALLLEGIHQCAQDGGFLRVLYPQAIMPSECQDILTWMQRNTAHMLLSTELPEANKIAHKHGWSGDTHADVALMYSPAGDIVIATFLYQPEWLVWEDSVPTFAAIGKLGYRFFNGAPSTPMD